MTSSAATTTLSFRPWVRNSADDNSLGHVLARVNLERGHFRDITEASLQEEIAAEGGLELSESESEEDEENEAEAAPTAKSKPTTREDLYRAKAEMQAHVAAAEQDVLMALDFVSLLLSKDAPRPAQATISPFLKQNVPLGSLGTDLWQRMPGDRAREAQDDLIAANVRMQGLQESADEILAAANVLQNNVRRETQYWDQILSISESGWNMSRVSGNQHRLAVRFGFSETSPEFARRGVAALHANTDGSITLESGVGSKPKGLRAVLRKQGKIVGVSKLPELPTADETTLEARVRYARDSLYDEELFHEMIRESRTIASLGVGMKGSAIHFNSEPESDAALRVSLELVPLDGDSSLDHDPSADEDSFAHALVLAARLLFIQAHRERLKRRSQVPLPLTEKQKDDRPVVPILRPMMGFIMYRTALRQLNAYVDRVAKILRTAQVPVEHLPAELFLVSTEIRDSESLVRVFMRPWTSCANMTILNPSEGGYSVRLRFDLQISLSNAFGPTYGLALSEPAIRLPCNSILELSTAVDARLASCLADLLLCALIRGGGVGWGLSEREALLVKGSEGQERRESMWVTSDSRGGVLSVCSLDRKVTWKLDGESEGNGFCDAAKLLLQTEQAISRTG